ncbi:MAG: hypothetical protein HAW62_05545 [Endozoicomonadaceae bacterium]|nr:hypothetical protein [Endozoicomonadaceae bacterium]
MEYDTQEHVKVAVYILDECSKFKISNKVTINALLLAMQDTLSTIPKEERLLWRNRLHSIFNMPVTID